MPQHLFGSPRFFFLTAFLLTATVATARADAPKVLDPRLELTLVASDPDIVTPVGVAVDRRGRVFVVESNTHFPLDGYTGAKHDFIKVFEDRNKDGKFETRSIFADGLHHTMHIGFSPQGRLYVVQRDGVFIIDDRDGDGRGDNRTPVLTLNSSGHYPHNGLSSLAFSPDGLLYVGMGENSGEKYELKGIDGSTESGEGDGGNVFRCRLDGKKLERVARGFWNPFGLAFYGKDHLLSVDNDPDARPPNRLLDVIPGADFGFRQRWGRNGLHPFQSWNGELPGTLPMAGPVGEAASGILPAYAAKLPPDFANSVLVTSWGDHRLEAHKISPSGATLVGQMTVIVKGDENFRPVGIAAAPDGSVFFSDWVDKSYNVHGKGRLWRLVWKGAPAGSAHLRKSLFPSTPARLRLVRLLAAKSLKDGPPLIVALNDKDPFIHNAAVTTLSRPFFAKVALTASEDTRSSRARLGGYLALRRGKHPQGASLVQRALGDADESVRIAALIWAAEDKTLPAGKERSIDRTLESGALSPGLIRIYAAAAAALKVPAAAIALPPGEDALLSRLKKTAATDVERKSQEEALWKLSESKSPQTPSVLKGFALDTKQDPELRADATMVLAMLGATEGLEALYKDASDVVKIGAQRAFKQNNSETVRPTDEDGWRKAATEGKSNPRAGRRVFFHPGIGCFRCHRVGGVGGQVGPDLSTIARGMNVEKLVSAIWAPSRDIGPENAARVIETTDGRTLNGILQKEPDGALVLHMVSAEPVRLRPEDIKVDTRSDVSLMPEGLQETMTIQDFRDLMAFLAAQK